MVLAAVALTGLLAAPARAGLIQVGMTDDFQELLIYDPVNNVTWFDSPYIDTATNLQQSLDNTGYTVTVNGTNITGWKLPTIAQSL